MSTAVKLVSAMILMFCSNAHCRSLQNSTNESDSSVSTLTTNRRQFLDSNCKDYLEAKEYILLDNGSLLLPSSDSIYAYETYYLQNGTAFLCTNQTAPTRVATGDPIFDHSREFLSCGHVLIDNEEYELLKNGSIRIKMYSRTYGPRDYYMIETGIYVCVPEYEEMTFNMSRNDTLKEHLNKFPESFVYVTYVGLVLSILSLVSHLTVFCLVSSVRNLPGCCLASLSLSLLQAYLCFMALEFVEVGSNHCANLGMSVYYFFLTSFFWMNAIAFDVWRSFRVVMRELRISSHVVPWRRFLLYSLYSWMVPAALTALVKAADSTDLLPTAYRPSFGHPICWFGQRKALMVFFAVPLCVVMLLNAVFFLDVTYVISRATLRTSHSHEATLKRRFFMFMRLALIMGLTWVVGLVAAYADNQYLWYVFVILNTLQGLFIFVVFSCSSKVRRLCFKRYRNRSKTGYSTSVRTISQMSNAAL